MGESRDCAKVRDGARDHRRPARKGTQRSRPVGREEHSAAPRNRRPRRLHGRVSKVEALRFQSLDFAEQQAALLARPCPRKLDIAGNQQALQPGREKRGDRGRGPQHIDNDVAVGSRAQGVGREAGDFENAGHGHSIADRRAMRHRRDMLMTMDPRPVGIFDSGVGGLSVLGEFRKLAPSERVIYFADIGYFPYGPRPAAEVRKRAFAIVHRLMESNVKLVIVACNTASAAAIDDLRSVFDVPFVGMVPGVKPAASRSRSGCVVILATPGTLDGELYARVVEDFGGRARITSVPGTGLAEIVERGEAGTAKAREAVRGMLGPEVEAGADTVVLGCTHYHFLTGDIRAEFPDIDIVDTSEAVARRAVQVLADLDQLAPAARPGEIDLIVTGDPVRFRAAMAAVGFAPTPTEATA